MPEKVQGVRDLPEIGSRWYAWGRHVEVVAHTTRDGEPAVRVKEKGANKPERFAVIGRLFLRRAIPSEGW